MGSSPGFGSARHDPSCTARTTARTGERPVRTRFRSGYVPAGTEPLDRVEQLAGSFFNRHAIGRTRPPTREGPSSSSRRLWTDGFSDSFTPLAGVLFTFPSRYSFAIGRLVYLALDRGRPSFPRGSSCPAVLTYHRQDGRPATATGLSPCLARLSRRFACRSARLPRSQRGPPQWPYNPSGT